MEKLHKLKKCYICLPIAGLEDTVFERSEQAKHLVKCLGYEPICPLELNEQNKENIDTHVNYVPDFMGNDIKVLIGECDAIFVCDGWEYSKGCNVELECAKQYKKNIFWQSIPRTMSIYEALHYKLDELYAKYRYANFISGPQSLSVSIVKREIDEYKTFLRKFFNIEYNMVEKGLTVDQTKKF